MFFLLQLSIFFFFWILWYFVGCFFPGHVWVFVCYLQLYECFLSLGKFSSIILLKIWFMPLTWDFSFMLIIPVFCWCLTFLLFSLLILSRPSTLSLSHDSLSSVWIIIFVRLYPEYSHWGIEVFQFHLYFSFLFPLVFIFLY